MQITQEWNTPANETMEHFRRAVEGGDRALKGDRVGVYQNVYLEIDGKGKGRISAMHEYSMVSHINGIACFNQILTKTTTKIWKTTKMGLRVMLRACVRVQNRNLESDNLNSCKVRL